MAEKACTKCGVVQPLSEFHAKRNGKASECKVCSAARNLANRESRRVRCPGYTNLRAMITRCHNPNSNVYARYGGRGIRVCDEWRGPGGFERFIAHIGPKPSPLHEVDRIDNNRGYEPGNVRWATTKANARNKGVNRKLTCRGETKLICDWAKEVGCSPNRIGMRLRRGWSVEDAIFAPRKPQGGRKARSGVLSR